MTSTAPSPLAAAAAGFNAVWQGALDAIRSGSGVAEQLENMNDEAILRVLDELGAVQHAVEVLAARVVGAIALRPSPSGRDGTLVRAAGYANPGVMVAERWRVSRARGAAIAEVGAAITQPRGLLGELEECPFPEIAAALEPTPEPDDDTEPTHVLDGTTDPTADPRSAVAEGDPHDHGTLGSPRSPLSVDGAAVIVRELRNAGRICTKPELQAASVIAIEHAAHAPLQDVTRIAKLVRTRLDQDGREPRDELLRRAERCTIHELPTGMTLLRAELAPESAAFIRAGLDALIAATTRRPHFIHPDTADPAEQPDGSGTPMPDGPTLIPIDRRRAIALTETFRHLAGCSAAATELTPVTVIIRTDHDTLQTGLGTATIDGIDEPIGPGALRRLAADANLIPMILNGPSQVLDLGTSTRLFTRAQKLALAERDGGCAWTGCTHPPSFTEAHHIRWWSQGGPTNLDNGVLLCPFHHHRIHDDHWTITIQNGIPWFIPPSHIDRHRTPIRGGRIHLAA
ncbi:HNH endonuclease signature motif containing protein [Plantibacter sp. ME-Dv--P-122b]|uniref:HNH endonuclease signature motif containing protein n=1 Tax=Plantibacter sp. ME-Dv--P-122b TaxID=3040300 RepID=UPI00254A1453|nr:HNH endonuclease signature motif containing protein [Plantibacter sp. ME-Dv--P-122b]